MSCNSSQTIFKGKIDINAYIRTHMRACKHTYYAHIHTYRKLAELLHILYGFSSICTKEDNDSCTSIPPHIKSVFTLFFAAFKIYGNLKTNAIFGFVRSLLWVPIFFTLCCSFTIVMNQRLFSLICNSNLE